MAMDAELLERPAIDCKQWFLDLLALAQKRESELEAAYVEDRATPADLAELEQVRMKIDATLEALDDMGYFNPS